MVNKDSLDKIPDHIEAKISQHKADNILAKLQDGTGFVVGEEVDEQNRLIYIINRDGVITAEYAETVKVIPNDIQELRNRSLRVSKNVKSTKKKDLV